MRFTALLMLAAGVAAFGQTLEPLQRFDNSVGPAPYFNPSQDTLKRSVKRALPSRRSALPAVLDHVLPPLSEAELGKLKPSGEVGSARPFLKTVGLHRATLIDVAATGRWQTTTDGQRVFRFSLSSPAAQGVRLHFRNFHVGAGRVWIHDGSGEETEVFGPYTADGPWGNGEFWSDYVLADTVVLEFEAEAAFREGDPLPFELREISHLVEASPVLPMPEQKNSVRRSEAVACHLDAACYPEWQQSTRGIARMLFEAEGGAFTCSGTLLNSRPQSNIPWFLTADHCISDEASARSLQAFWFYQTSSCNGVPPDMRSVPRTLGATYVAGVPYERGDATLLRLREIPNGVFFQGWSAEEVQLTGAATGVHHPAGSYRRISFGSLRQPIAYTGIDPTKFIGVQLDGGGLTQPGSSGSALFARPGIVIGQLSHGPKMEENEYCGRLPFPVAYGRFSLLYPLIRQYLEGTGGTTPPPQNNSRALTSGTTVSLTMPAVDAATMFGDTFEIAVPQGSTRLEVRLNAPADAEVGVLARFGQPPLIENGNAVADSSQVGRGPQTIILAPPRAGTYFIRLALLTKNRQVAVELTATVGAASTNTTSRGLTSGEAVPFRFEARANPTLYNGASGFTIQVPPGAMRLDVQLRTETAGADVDLYVRHGQDIAVADRQIVADARSETTSGSEDITLSPVTPGTYFIALTVLNPHMSVAGQIRATVTMSGTGPGNVLASGQPKSITLPAVQSATIWNGDNGFRIDVPAGTTRLEVALRSNADADVDLFVRPSTDVTVDGNRVVAEWRSENEDSNERIVINNPKAATYYIALVQFTRNVAVQAVLTATITGGSVPPPGQTNVLTPGRPASFRIGPVDSPTLFNGENGFVLRVPQGATRVDLNLRTATPNADVDAFVRRGQDVSIQDRRPVFDYSSESPSGQETIVIDGRSNPPLEPGDYYVALALFDTGVEATGTITATVVTGNGSGGGLAPTNPTVLSPGQPAPFQLPAVDQPTLFNGNYSYVVDVPQGASRLQIQLSSEFARVDTDLYVRHEAQPEVAGGDVIADHVAGTDFANETLTISSQSSPALRPGKYYISIATFTTGAATRGTITATLSRSIFSQTQSGEAKSEIGLREQPLREEAAPFVLPDKTEMPKLRIKRQTEE